MEWVLASSVLFAAAFLVAVACHLPYWQDRNDVILQKGWVIEKMPTPGFHGNNYRTLKTMKGWESIAPFNPEVGEGQYAVYVYANGSVYELDRDAEPMVRAIIQRLLEVGLPQAA